MITVDVCECMPCSSSSAPPCRPLPCVIPLPIVPSDRSLRDHLQMHRTVTVTTVALAQSTHIAYTAQTPLIAVLDPAVEPETHPFAYGRQMAYVTTEVWALSSTRVTMAVMRSIVACERPRPHHGRSPRRQLPRSICAITTRRSLASRGHLQSVGCCSSSCGRTW